jgi:hypothetical protein
MPDKHSTKSKEAHCGAGANKSAEAMFCTDSPELTEKVFHGIHACWNARRCHHPMPVARKAQHHHWHGLQLIRLPRLHHHLHQQQAMCWQLNKHRSHQIKHRRTLLVLQAKLLFSDSGLWCTGCAPISLTGRIKCGSANCGTTPGFPHYSSRVSWQT